MTKNARPYFSLNIISHPDNEVRCEIESHLRTHFLRRRYEEVESELEVTVFGTNYDHRVGHDRHASVDWAEAEIVLPVILLDQHLASDSKWVENIDRVIKEARQRHVQVLPVATDATGLDINFRRQALRFDAWPGSDADKIDRLVLELLHGGCQFFRNRLVQVLSPVPFEMSHVRNSRKVQVFLSHSKHDADGVRVATEFRRWVHENSSLATFYDLHDIPVGVDFDAFLREEVGQSAMIAVRTDSYSSRDMCRLEVLEAKYQGTPLVVADCLRDGEHRSMPQLGNLPVLRMSPCKCDRMGEIVRCLLDELLVHLMWATRTESLRAGRTDVRFTARPPELIMFGGRRDFHAIPEYVVVCLGPKPSLEETRTIRNVAPQVRIESLSEWLRDTP